MAGAGTFKVFSRTNVEFAAGLDAPVPLTKTSPARNERLMGRCAGAVIPCIQAPSFRLFPLTWFAV